MWKIIDQKIFSIVSGSILFLFGILGFSFRSFFDVGVQYLVFSLILGFWGILCGVAQKNSAEK